MVASTFKKNIMRKIGLFLFGLVLSSALFAQTKINDANAQVRDVKNFHAVKVSQGIKLLLTQGSTEAVAVSASDPEVRDRIKTVVEGGVLKIYYDNKTFNDNRKNKELKAYVSAIKIDDIDLSSGAMATIDGELKADDLELEATSGSIFKGKVNAKKMEIEQNSGSIVTVSGIAGELTIEGSSGSLFHGYDLVAENCKAETSSGSAVQITVNKELSAQASSGGSIKYAGSAVIRDIHTSSGGVVSRKG